MRACLSALAALAALLAGGCALLESPPPTAAAPPSATATTPQSGPLAVKPAPPTRPGPIPVRPIDVKTDCSFRDETGYGGTLKLEVAQARVSRFEARVSIPRRGHCAFDLKDFRQTKELPAVELSHAKTRCVVRVWEQGERVTVAFQQCEKQCSGNAYRYLWPILNDRRQGACA